jgi:hypothetical protein
VEGGGGGGGGRVEGGGGRGEGGGGETLQHTSTCVGHAWIWPWMVHKRAGTWS